jgi:hypothetical protein
MGYRYSDITAEAQRTQRIPRIIPSPFQEEGRVGVI